MLIFVYLLFKGLASVLAFAAGLACRLWLAIASSSSLEDSSPFSGLENRYI